ncbi:MAG: hypothetical protein WA919_30240 [Coleofasciculaceae cyanobacterium]
MRQKLERFWVDGETGRRGDEVDEGDGEDGGDKEFSIFNLTVACSLLPVPSN